MSVFKIVGGKSLNGEIVPQGAKNEALQVLSAVLLTDKEVLINNIPDILDINNAIKIIEGLGVKVIRKSKNSYLFIANEVDLKYLETLEYQENGRKIRGSIMLLGPLLARFKKAIIPKPGGDKIGRRNLDSHFLGLEQMGAEFSYDKEKRIFIGRLLDRFKGQYILMPEASVTGTANILMAAVLAEGRTTIYNAACEPYIQQLCKMLVNMGAKIEGIGSNLLVVYGVESLGGTTHDILPDMVEIGSWIGLSAMTKSEITIKNVSLQNLGIIPRVFGSLGIEIKVKGDDIFIPKQECYTIKEHKDGRILTISDAPWPGFTPDLLSIILTTAIQAKGTLLIHQKMFESRLFFVDKLIDMGARVILCDPHRATVIGFGHKFQLKGTEMSSPDIRAGMSLLIAALSAKGTSTMQNVEQIDRGYENIEEKLRSVGAIIQRV